MKTQHTTNGQRWIAPVAAVGLLLAVGGIWKLVAASPRVHSQPAPAAATAPPSDEALTTVPVAPRQSASDKQVAKWAATARKSPRNADAWVNLGDAFMQKARETFDLAYYGRAEAAY